MTGKLLARSSCVACCFCTPTFYLCIANMIVVVATFGWTSASGSLTLKSHDHTQFAPTGPQRFMHPSTRKPQYIPAHSASDILDPTRRLRNKQDQVSPHVDDQGGHGRFSAQSPPQLNVCTCACWVLRRQLNEHPPFDVGIQECTQDVEDHASPISSRRARFSGDQQPRREKMRCA